MWWIRYAGPDGRIRFESSGSSNFRDAEILLTEKRKFVDEGKDPKPKRIGNHTFRELSVPYLEWAKRQKAYKGKAYALRLLVREFGNLTLRHITTRLIEEYQSRLIAAGRKPATVNRYTATVKHMIRKAVEWEMAQEDILRKVRGAKQLPENNKRLRYLSVGECKTFIRVCAPHLRQVVIALFHTGGRLNEILSLTWDRVDLLHGFIHLDKTKNDERRDIPISGTLRETLFGIVRRIDSPYVFLSVEGKRIKSIRNGFKSALRRAGITDFKIHDCRHTFASHLVMGGVPLYTLGKLLGHKDPLMTQRYAHLAPEHMTAAVSVLDNALNGSVNYTKTIQSVPKLRATTPQVVEKTGTP